MFLPPNPEKPYKIQRYSLHFLSTYLSFSAFNVPSPWAPFISHDVTLDMSASVSAADI